MKQWLSLFNAVDAAAAVIMLLGLVSGLTRGFFGELTRLFNVAVVLLVAVRLHVPFGDLIVANTRMHDAESAGALAFLVIAASVGLCLLALRILLQLVMKVSFTARKSRTAGALFGLARGVLLVFVIVFGISLWPHNYIREVFVNSSFVGRCVRKLAGPATDKLGRVRVTVDSIPDEIE